MSKHLPSSRKWGAKLLASMTVVTTLAGCASFSNDGGFGSVEQTTRERLNKDVKWARSDAEKSELQARAVELLANPLTVDDAIQVALYNNRGLQAAFFDLGISEADLVQAGRLPNPHFSMLRASKPENGIREYKIEQALTFNIFALITMPLAVEVEKRNFVQTQRMAVIEVARLVAETRQAYFTAVAADESVRYMRKVKQAAEAAAELARRMAAVGNFSKLRQAREQAFYADAALNLARSEQSAVSARERLTRVLGVAERNQIKLPERLPDLPKTAKEISHLEQQALDQRLDLQVIRLETEALAKNLGLTQATRFINVLEVGPARVLEGERNSSYKKGYEISFELPIFDWGGAKVAKAKSVYMQAVERAMEATTIARSEVREAYHAYRINYDIAKHYRDEIVPLNKRISDENMLRYNGMLIGVFDLLADARIQIGSVNSYIEALRDFWIAQGDLEMSLIGKPSLNVATRASIAATGRADH